MLSINLLVIVLANGMKNCMNKKQGKHWVPIEFKKLVAIMLSISYQ